MYITRATITGLEETATQPIAVSVIQDLRELLGLKDTVPIRIGENQPLLLSKDSKGLNTHIPDIVNDELVVNYAETNNDGYDVSLATVSPVTKPIYVDKDVRSYIKPILTKRKIVFTVNFYSKSKSKVTAMINRLSARTASDTRNRLHNIQYHYYVPDIVIDLLSSINDLKNNHITPPLDFDTYLANTCSSQADVLNDESGSPLKSRLVMRELQQSVFGVIETDTYTLEKEKDDDSNRWGFTLDYSIEFELPTQLFVTYPIVVYNQPIPERFRLKHKPQKVHYGNRTSDSDSLDRLTTRESKIFHIPKGSYYLRIPFEDTLVLPKPEVGYVRLFSCISVIDQTNPTTLFYLDELPYIAFKPDVLELIKLEASRMGIDYTSIFYIDIYNHDEKLYSHKVIVTVETTIVNGVTTDRVLLSTDKPLDIKGCYRVSFNVLTDLTLLRLGGIDILKKNISVVDAKTQAKFSVIDSVLGVLNLDITKLRPEFNITDTTSSIDIGLNITNDLWHKVFTTQESLVLTEMLTVK